MPRSRPAVLRCIFDSLAAAYARSIDDARRLSGHSVNTLHIVGGGSSNAVVCRLTVRATGLPVVAGPAEATALGNVLVQARACGALDGDLTAMRMLVRATQRVSVWPRMLMKVAMSTRMP